MRADKRQWSMHNKDLIDLFITLEVDNKGEMIYTIFFHEYVRVCIYKTNNTIKSKRLSD